MDTTVRLPGMAKMKAKFMFGKVDRDDWIVDVVEAAYLAVIGVIKADVQEFLRSEWDAKAFLVFSDLVSRRKFARVKRPYVLMLKDNVRLKVYPIYADEEIELEELAKADVVAIIDGGGEIIYYKVEIANL